MAKLTKQLKDRIASALEGASNDAEHDCLVQVAEHFGIEWDHEASDETEFSCPVCELDTGLAERVVGTGFNCQNCGKLLEVRFKDGKWFVEEVL